MEKLKADPTTQWNERGEFVYKGVPIRVIAVGIVVVVALVFNLCDQLRVPYCPGGVVVRNDTVWDDNIATLNSTESTSNRSV